jgi:ribosomal-protein-alanine N-acetyltransferase
MRSLCHMRDARVADIDAITRIELVSFVHAGERFGERRVRYLINSPRAIVRVAELDGKAAGWICGFAVTRSAQPWGRIYALAVDPAVRGRSMGSQLLNEMVRLVRERGAARVFLEVRTDNHTAVRLYENAGFAAIRLLENFYGPGITALRMLLTVPSGSGR